jgi:hypothetical protein
VGCALVGMALARADAASGVVPLRTGDRVTLGDVQANPLTLDAGSRRSSRSIKVRLPAGAKQSWSGDGAYSYLTHLSAVVEVSSDTGPGTAYLSAILNRCAAVQLRIVVPQRQDAARHAYWTTIGLLEGVRKGLLTRRSARIRTANYLPDCSFQGRDSLLSFKFERFGQIDLERVLVLPSSGIESSPVTPPDLRLRPSYPEKEPELGEPFEIWFDLINDGDRAAEDVRVRAISHSPRLQIEGAKEYAFDQVDDERDGSFVLSGSKLGRYFVELQVSSPNANQPSARIAVLIGPRRPEDEGDRKWLVGCGVLGVIGLALLIRRFRRSRHSA